MFDIGWSELLVVGVVSLIVVGPKDLPGMFRTVGRFTGKARGMAREFQSAMNDAADSAGVGDIAKDLKNATSKKSLGLDKLDGVAKRFEDWSPTESAADKSKPGSETAKLSKERAEASKKIQEAAAKKASERIAAEEAAAKAAKDVAPTAKSEGTVPKETKVAAKKAVKKPAAKRTAAKKTAAPKMAAATKTAQKSTAKKPAAKKPAAKKTTKTAKPAPKKAAATESTGKTT